MRHVVWGLRCLTIAAIMIACSEPPTQPPPRPGDPGLSIVAGADGVDTIHAVLAQALVVAVHDSRGEPLSDVELRFANAPSQTASAFVTFSLADGWVGGQYTLTTRTDVRGRAIVRVKLGRIAGRAEVLVAAPALNESATATFEVEPGAPHSVSLSPDDTALYVGASIVLASAVTDREGNPVAAAPSFVAAPSGGVLSHAGGLLRAERIGRGFVVATLGELADTAWVSVMPRATIVAYERPSFSADPVVARTGRLVLFELDGSEYRTLIAPEPAQFFDGYGSGLQPRWSPSGDEIAYIAGYQLRAVDTTGASRLIVGAPLTVWHDYSPEWSAPGDWIYFTLTQSSGGGQSLRRVRPDGTGEEATLADWPLPVSPGPAPVGNLLAYQTDHSRDHLIRLVDTETGARVALDIPGGWPRWSPTGEWIAYVGRDGRLRVMRPDGSGRRLVGGIPVHGSYSWSPDGEWIIASSGQPRPENPFAVGLFVINVASGEVLPLRLSRTVVQPSWRP